MGFNLIYGHYVFSSPLGGRHPESVWTIVWMVVNAK